MRRPTQSEKAQIEDLVIAGLHELAQGRGGRLYRADLAAFLGIAEADLVDTLVSDIMNEGLITDNAVAVALDGLALIYVAPHSRRASRGTALYRALVEDGDVELWAKPGDRAAKSFAESLGLKARLLVMSADSDLSDEQ